MSENDSKNSQVSFKQKLVNFWKRVWGQDIPDFDYSTASEDEFERADELKKHIRKKESRKAQRVLLCIAIMLLCCLIFACVKNFINGTPFLACLGKDVCIYRGPKLNNPAFTHFSQKTDNGDVFVFTKHSYNYLYHKLKIFREFFLGRRHVLDDFLFDKQAENFIGFKEGTIECYSQKEKKFVNIREKNIPDYNFVTNYKNKALLFFYEFIKGETPSPYIYSIDSKNKTIEKFYKNILHKEYNQLNTDLYFLKKYNDKYLLFITNYNKIPYLLFDNGYTSEYKWKYKEVLYLFNLETKELIKLPDFATPGIYSPIPQDVRVLDNGKIIIPFRSCNREFIGNYCYSNWDHIEVYLPTQNRFISEMNVDVLKDNLFDVDLENGNILFVNKQISYIFDNITNKFTKLNDNDQVVYYSFVEKIREKLAIETGVSLDEPIQERCKILKLSERKFLVFSGDYESYGNTMYETLQYKENKRRTLIVDFEKMTVKNGPKFLYPHYTAQIVQLGENKFMVIGGLIEQLSLQSTSKYSIPIAANKYVQIIETK